MAFTERYVTSAAGGGGDGSSGSPWTLTESFNNAAAGDRVNVQSDANYAIANISVSAVGAITDYIVFRGYDTVIGDLENQGRGSDGLLDTTGFPTITSLSNSSVPNRFVVFQNMAWSASLVAPLVGSSSIDSWCAISCSFTNTANNAGAGACKGDDNCVLIDCDLVCSGASHGAVFDTDVDAFVHGCFIKGVANVNYCAMNSGVVSNCTIVGSGSGVGIAYLLNFGAPNYIIGNTLYNLGTGITYPNTSYASTHPLKLIVNNHITDCGTGINNLYSGSSDIAIIEIFNRTRDNTTPRTGIGDGIVSGEVTTDTGGPETDYTDAGSDDLTLISGAPGVEAALDPNAEIGAYQNPDSGGGGIITHPGMTGGMRG